MHSFKATGYHILKTTRDLTFIEDNLTSNSQVGDRNFSLTLYNSYSCTLDAVLGTYI